MLNRITKTLITKVKLPNNTPTITRSYFTHSILNNGRYNNGYDIGNQQPPTQQLNNQKIQHQPLIFTQNHKTEQTTTPVEEPKPLIYELNEHNFNDYTMKQTLPVILNCYSDVGTISPALTEALNGYAEEYPGCIVVSNLCFEKNKELIKALRVTDLPTIFTIHKGNVLQQFVGLPDHESLDKIITELVKLSGGLLGGKTIEQQETIAELFIKSYQYEEALEIFKSLLENDTTQLHRTLLGVIQCYTHLSQLEQAEHYIEEIQSKFPIECNIDKNKQLAISKRIIEFKKQIINVIQPFKDIPIDQFEQGLIQEPSNFESRFELSLLHFQQGQYEKSINQLLTILKLNKSYINETIDNSTPIPTSAKSLLIKIFEQLDPKDPIVIKSKKTLNNIWFS